MATVKQKSLVLDDTLGAVVAALEDRPQIPYATLKEIASQVSAISDGDTMRARILELAEGLEQQTLSCRYKELGYWSGWNAPRTLL